MPAKYHKTLFPLIALISFILVSCDPYGKYEYTVDNQSDRSLIVTYRVDGSTSDSSLSVPTQSKTQIISFETRNGLYDFEDDFLDYFFEEFTINPSDGAQITKNYKDRYSWKYETRQSGGMLWKKSGKNSYILTLEDEHFITPP